MEKAELSSSDLAELVQDGVTTLPDWEKMDDPFERIAELETGKADKDEIVLWWKENSRYLTRLAKLRQVSRSINLPRNEASAVEETYRTSLESMKTANTRLLAFVTEKIGTLKKIAILYARPLGILKAEDQAADIRTAIQDFKGRVDDIELKTAVASAIIDTRSENPDDNSFRQKTAQHVLSEIFDQLPIGRIMAVHHIIGDVTEVIDSPKSERIDLTSTFLSEPWRSEERKVMLKKVNRMRRVLKKLEAETADKIALNTLWRWAKGDLPKDANVFKILEYANRLDIGITNTVAEAWQSEAERIDDEEEDEE